MHFRSRFAEGTLDKFDNPFMDSVTNILMSLKYYSFETIIGNHGI